MRSFITFARTILRCGLKGTPRAKLLVYQTQGEKPELSIFENTGQLMKLE
jgi:hypothetical protein